MQALTPSIGPLPRDTLFSTSTSRCGVQDLATVDAAEAVGRAAVVELDLFLLQRLTAALAHEKDHDVRRRRATGVFLFFSWWGRLVQPLFRVFGLTPTVLASAGCWEIVKQGFDSLFISKQTGVLRSATNDRILS